MGVLVYWLLLILGVGVEEQLGLVVVVEGTVAAGVISLSIAAFKDPLNPMVQIAGYAMVYFAFAFASDGSALAAASLVAFLAWTGLGVFAGAKLTPLGRPIKFMYLSPQTLKVALLVVVVGSVLAFSYLVARLGGVLAFVAQSFRLSLLAREQGLEIFFLPGIILVSVTSLWLTYLRTGILFTAVVVSAGVVAILSFRRANVFYLLMALVLYRHYFVRRLRVTTLVPVCLAILGFMLLIGSIRLTGFGTYRDPGPLTGLDTTIYEAYTFVLGNRLDYDFLARSGASLTAGMRFLLPSFLWGRGDYQTVPDALSAALYGETGFGTPPTLFGAMLIYLPPAIAPILAVVPGFLWGNVYGLLRKRERDSGLFLWYLATVLLAFDFFRTGDPFHSAKVAMVLFVTLIPITFVMRGAPSPTADNQSTDQH